MAATDPEDKILLSAPKIQTLPSALERDLSWHRKGEMLELVFFPEFWNGVNLLII